MKQITIGFSRASTAFPIFSWLIMAVQKTPYSHAYLKYTDEYLGQTMYYQASHSLVNYMSAATFLAQETVVQEFDFQVSDESFLAIMKFGADQAGKPYGTLEILGLALVEIAMLFGIKMNNPVRDEGTTFICDQLVAALLENCEGVVLPDKIDNMMPKDVFNMVKNLPKNLS